MKHYKLITSSSLLIILMFIFHSCEKDLPIVETKSVIESEITTTTAIVRGNVTDNGGDEVTERGICYGTALNPTVEKEASNGGNGDFEVTLTGLTPDTEYFVRAYAINSAGTSYGDNESFRTTIEIIPPEVQTESVEEITSISAVVQGNVLSDGGAVVTSRGICYGTSPNPTEKMPDDEVGNGIFTVTLTDLEIETDYYARAYATNSIGTAYGDDIPFKTIGNKPNAIFEVSKTTPNVGESVQFTDQSTNSPNTWNWDFGDGNLSSSQNPTHAYSIPGIYDVSLTVSNQHGSDTEIKTDYITAGSIPEADFTASPTIVLLGENVQFTDNSTNDPTDWEWDFGDGNTSTIQNPTHAYNTPGIYDVELIISNEHGSDTVIKADYINAGSIPEAEFTVSTTTVLLGNNVQFTDNSTNDPTGWNWDFGDGSTSTIQNPTHAYSIPGIYDVSLTVSNEHGSDTEIKADYITAGSIPEAEFTASSTTIIEGESVQFTDLSINTPTSWNWNFGDNSTSTVQNPLHLYSNAGTFTVILTATNALGSDIETKVNYISVVALPEVVSAAIENATPNRLDITFDQTMADVVPATSAFNVIVNSTARAVNSISISGNRVSLILASPVSVDNVVSVSYTKPTVLPLQTVSGGEAESFSRTVTNNVSTIIDGDGNTYTSVIIGSQEWLAQNLETTKFNNGTEIPYLTGDLTNWVTPGYKWYDDNSNYKDTYGALYNWYTVDEGSLCPAGWHVSSDPEWLTLIANAGGTSAAFYLKEDGTAHWREDNASDRYGFTALPGGYFRSDFWIFQDIGGYGWWWTSTQYSTTHAVCHWMAYSLNHVNSWTVDKRDGKSVRCVKD